MFAGTTATLITSARVGAAGAYFLEWNCAVVLWIGPILVRAVAARATRRWLLPVACAAQLLLADTFAVVRLVDEGTSFAESLRALPTMCAAIHALKGREPPGAPGRVRPEMVVTEEAGFVRVCGVQPVHHSFIMANLAQRGLWDQRPFVEALRRRVYPAVVVPFDIGKPIDTERWTPPMLRAIRQSYVTVAESMRWRALAPGTPRTIRQPQ